MTTTRTLWGDTPPDGFVTEAESLTVATVFDVSEAVTVGGVRFFVEAAANLAGASPETVAIYRFDGTLVVQAAYTGTPTDGAWNVGAVPDTALAAGRYVAAAFYAAPFARIAFTTGYFAANSPSNPPLSAPLNADTNNGNGRYLYGAAIGFPLNTFNATNYWIDPLISVAVAAPRASTSWTSTYTVGARAATSWTSSFAVRQRAAAAWTSAYAVRRREAVSWTSSYTVGLGVTRAAVSWASGYVVRSRRSVSWTSLYRVRTPITAGGQNIRLVLPYDVEGLIVNVLTRRHPEHLAKMERARNLPPRTFQQFQTVARMSDAGAIRLSGDTTPACLLGVIGAPDLARNENNNLDATFQLGMQITVFGQKRRDTIYRRDVMAWTAVECLLQRLPRSSDGLIHSVRLTDYEPLAEVETQRTVGDARLVFEVGVTDFMSITGFLPGDESTWPAEAGGAPLQPYDPVAPRPSAIPTFQVERVPIVE